MQYDDEDIDSYSAVPRIEQRLFQESVQTPTQTPLQTPFYPHPNMQLMRAHGFNNPTYVPDARNPAMALNPVMNPAMRKYPNAIMPNARNYYGYGYNNPAAQQMYNNAMYRNKLQNVPPLSPVSSRTHHQNLPKFHNNKMKKPNLRKHNRHRERQKNENQNKYSNFGDFREEMLHNEYDEMLYNYKADEMPQCAKDRNDVYCAEDIEYPV